MSTIAELLIKLGMDDGGLDKGMSSSQSKLKSWGESLRSVGTKLTAGVTLPLVGAGIAAINWASDQAEAANKVDSVFKGSAQSVKDWANDQSNTLLITKTEALDYVGTLGNMLTAQGLTTDSAAEMSEQWVGLAQDFSSFNNIPVDQALTAIRAGIVGEYEPLRSLGVVLDDATVKQKAMEMGLYDGTGALTGQARALAVNELLMEQTTNVQGDAAKTAKGFANQMRILKSNLKDTAAEIGQRFLPYAERFQRWLLDMLDAFDNLDPKWQNVIVAVLALAAALGPVLIAIGFMLPALGALATALGILLSPIGLLIVAIAALIGLGIYAWVNDLWGVRDAVSAVVDMLVTFATGLNDLRKYIQAVWEDGDKLNDWLTHFPEFLRPVIMGIGDFVNALHDFRDMLGPVAGDIGDVFQAIGEGNWAEALYEARDALLGLGSAITALSADTIGLIADGLQNLADKGGILSPALDTLAESTRNIEQGLRYLSGAFSQFLAGDYSGGILTLANALADLVVGAQQSQTAVVQAVAGIIQSLGQWILSATNARTVLQEWSNGILLIFSTLSSMILQSLQTLGSGVSARFSQMASDARAKASELASSVTTQFGTLSASVLTHVTNIANNVKNQFTNAKTNATSAVTSLVSDVTSQFITLSFSIYTHVTNIANNIKTGFDTAKSYAATAMSGLASTVISTLIGLVGSAYSMAQSIGGAIGSGLVSGIQSMIGSVISAAQGLVDAAMGILSNIPGFSPIEHVGQYYGAKLSGGFAEGIASAERMVSGASSSVVDAAIRPFDVSVAGGADSLGSVGAPIYNVQVITLEPGRWREFLDNAMAGGEFARGFGSELGLYTGQP